MSCPLCIPRSLLHELLDDLLASRVRTERDLNSIGSFSAPPDQYSYAIAFSHARGRIEALNEAMALVRQLCPSLEREALHR